MEPQPDDALLAVLSPLRALLQQGGEIVVLPMVRARDFAVAVRGTVVHVGLASAAFCGWTGANAPVSGHTGYCTLQMAPVYVLRGTLGETHLPQLTPLLEKCAAARERVVLATDEIDGGMLDTLLINKRRGVLDVLALTSRATGPRGLPLLAQLSGATPGRADGSLTLGSPGTVGTMLVTTEVAVLRDDAPGAGPVGLVYVGGDDLAEATARARAASRLVRQW